MQKEGDSSGKPPLHRQGSLDEYTLEKFGEKHFNVKGKFLFFDKDLDINALTNWTKVTYTRFVWLLMAVVCVAQKMYQPLMKALDAKEQKDALQVCLYLVCACVHACVCVLVRCSKT